MALDGRRCDVTVLQAWLAVQAAAPTGAISGTVAFTFSPTATTTAAAGLVGSAALNFAPTATGTVTRVYGPAPLPSLGLLGGFS